MKTRAVGHLRDVRRLVVATSRARLGLYVFARASLFANCFELTPTFRSLLQRPTDLRLLPEETYRTERLSTKEPDEDAAMVINDMPQMATFVYDLYRKKVEAIAKDPNVSSLNFHRISTARWQWRPFSFRDFYLLVISCLFFYDLFCLW